METLKCFVKFMFRHPKLHVWWLVYVCKMILNVSFCSHQLFLDFRLSLDGTEQQPHYLLVSASSPINNSSLAGRNEQIITINPSNTCLTVI